jgi:hypothetical protein
LGILVALNYLDSKNGSGSTKAEAERRMREAGLMGTNPRYDL